jgi:hypothetical protein
MATTTETSRTTHLLELMTNGDNLFNARNWQELEDVHHPDMIAYMTGSADPIYGRDAHGAAMQQLVEMFPDGCEPANRLGARAGTGTDAAGLPVRAGSCSRQVLWPNELPATVAQARDEGGEHPVHPVAFPGGGRGVDDLLHVAGLDVLAGDRADDRLGEPLAQPPLGVGVLAGPPVPGRGPVGVQVMLDQVRAGPLHVGRVGLKPFLDLLQLFGELRLCGALPVLPLPVLGEHRPPRLPAGLRRVHQNPEVQLDHRTGRLGGRSRVPPRSPGGLAAGGLARADRPGAVRTVRGPVVLLLC